MQILYRDSSLLRTDVQTPTLILPRAAVQNAVHATRKQTWVELGYAPDMNHYYKTGANPYFKTV